MSCKKSELTGDLINLWADKIPSNKIVGIFRSRLDVILGYATHERE